jgi:ABC-type polysaccharide/polyol phosphate transport system ATPase subunit
MANIKNLTRKCLYFEKGTLIGEGDPEELTATYETNMTSLTG